MTKEEKKKVINKLLKRKIVKVVAPAVKKLNSKVKELKDEAGKALLKVNKKVNDIDNFSKARDFDRDVKFKNISGEIDKSERRIDNIYDYGLKLDEQLGMVDVELKELDSVNQKEHENIRGVINIVQTDGTKRLSLLTDKVDKGYLHLEDNIGDINRKLKDYVLKEDLPKEVDITGGDNIIIVKKELKRKTKYIIHQDKVSKGDIFAVGSGIGVLRTELDNGYLDDKYLKLDASNDPITGALTINTNSTTGLLVEQTGVKSNVLVVDTTNARVGFGTATPSYKFHLWTDQGGTTESSIAVQNTKTGFNSASLIYAISASSGGYIGAFNSGYSEPYKARVFIYTNAGTNGLGFAVGNNAQDFRWYANYIGVGIYERMRLSATGELVINPEGTTGTTVVPLQVKGNVSQTANLQEWQNSSGSILAQVDANGAFVFNEQGADADSRVEGDTDVNLLYIDAGADKVGIGDAAPGEKLDVAGNTNVTGVYKVDDVQVISNRVVDARIDDTPNSGDATTDGIIAAIQSVLQTHGLAAAA